MAAMICAKCNMECTQKSGLLTCTRCKSLTHFACSKLPKYCFNLLHNFNTVYVCEICAEDISASDTTTTNYTLKSANQSNRSNDTIRTLRDIQSALKEITSEMESAHTGTLSESIGTIDHKIELLESRIEDKLRDYLNKKLLKHKEDIVESIKSNDVKTPDGSNLIHKVSREIRSSRDETADAEKLCAAPVCHKCSYLEQDMRTKTSTIETLKSELAEQNKVMAKLERDFDALSQEHCKRSASIANLDIEVEEYKQSPQPSYVEQLKQYIKILELQISVNNGQNEILAVAGQQKDSKLLQLRNQIRDMGARLGKVVEDAAQLPDSIVPQVSNQQHLGPSNIALMMGNNQHVSEPQSPYPTVLSNCMARRNNSHVATHPKNRVNNIQSNSYLMTSSSADNSAREDVMVVDGSLYQRVGQLQQG